MKQMRGLRAIPSGEPRRGQRRWKDDKFQFGHAELEDHWDRDSLGSGAGGAGVGVERAGSVECKLGVRAGGRKETCRDSAKGEEKRTKGRPRGAPVSGVGRAKARQRGRDARRQWAQGKARLHEGAGQPGHMPPRQRQGSLEQKAQSRWVRGRETKARSREWAQS